MAGRKPTVPAAPEKPVIDAAAVTADLQAAGQGQMAALRRVQDSALDVGRLAGRIESMLFLRTCADRVIAEAFLEISNGKKYKDLLIDGVDGNLRTCADLDEACAHLFGKSYRACRELAQNYEALGADLYDKAQAIGLHRNDYRAIRALPSDDQDLVQQAIETATDREAVTELLMELTERHAKKVLGLQEDLAAKDKVLTQKNEHIARLDETLSRREGMAEAERTAELRSELLAHAIGVEAGLTNQLKPAFAAYTAHLAATGGAMDDYVAATLGQLERVITEIRDEFGIHGNHGNDSVPAWAA